MLAGKLHSAFWFLKRPHLYPQFFHLLILRLFHANEPDKAHEAGKWCEETAVSVPEAVAQLTGMSSPMDLRSRHADIFARAQDMANACPITMGDTALSA